MNWNSASVVSVLAGAFALAGVARAAAAPACAPLPVSTDEAIAQRWPDLPAQIRETFRTRIDVDRCAGIQLVGTGAAIQLTVSLPDGRTASRVVARREDVLPALEALLLLPEDGEPGDTAGTTPARPPEPLRAPAVARLAPPTPSSDRPAPFGIEIALEAEARASAGWVGAGGGVAAFLDVSHWLVGFAGRIDRYQSPETDLGVMALELLALGGHRFGLGGRRALDLVAGPALVRHDGTTAMVTQMTSGGVMTTSQTSSDGLLRLVVSSRLTFGAQSLVRTFVQVDADIGSPGPDSAERPGDPGLPPWTVGVAVGAALGTR